MIQGKSRDYKLDDVSYREARNEAVKATTDLLMKEGVLASGAGRGATRKGAVKPKEDKGRAISLEQDFGALEKRTQRERIAESGSNT